MALEFAPVVFERFRRAAERAELTHLLTDEGSELVLGVVFVAVAMRFLRLRTIAAARLLFIGSIVYLPLLLIALVLTKS